MQLVVGQPPRVAAGTTLPLFNKKGRLKTGPRRLRLWPGREPCLRWPSSTPAKVWESVGGGVGHRWEGRVPCLRWPSCTPAKVWGSVGGGGEGVSRALGRPVLHQPTCGIAVHDLARPDLALHLHTCVSRCPSPSRTSCRVWSIWCGCTTGGTWPEWSGWTL